MICAERYADISKTALIHLIGMLSEEADATGKPLSDLLEDAGRKLYKVAYAVSHAEKEVTQV